MKFITTAVLVRNLVVYILVNLHAWTRSMKPTLRVYLEDPYVRELSATVIDYVHEKGDRYYVVLDRTIFHPRSGGQPSDTGVAMGHNLEFSVLKVLEIDNVLVHYGKVVKGALERELPIKLLVNWDFRYLVMKLHTAGHILDGAVMRVYGKVLNTLDAHHGPPEAYVVYDAGDVPGIDKLKLIEEYANKITQESRPVKAYWVKREELPLRAYNAPNLQRLPVRDAYRIVEIEGINAIPCTGTHVKDTSEVGRIKVLKAEPHSRGFKLVYSI